MNFNKFSRTISLFCKNTIFGNSTNFSWILFANSSISFFITVIFNTVEYLFQLNIKSCLNFFTLTICAVRVRRSVLFLIDATLKIFKVVFKLEIFFFYWSHWRAFDAGRLLMLKTGHGMPISRDSVRSC